MARVLCICPCGKEFEPKRSNQVYFNAEHRRRDSNRRWPVKRQSSLPVSFRKSHRERQKPETGYVTSHEGTQVAQPKPRTLLALGGAFGAAALRRKALLTTAEVAELFRVSAWAVRYWRMQKVGPPYVRVGGWAIRYPRAALVAYLQTNLFEPEPRLRGSRPLPQPQRESGALLEGRK
jgi:hypothetical protein